MSSSIDTTGLIAVGHTRSPTGEPLPAGRRGWFSQEGAPFPQGVTWMPAEKAYNFVLYSKHAESVTLLLYRPDELVDPVMTYRLDPGNHKTGRIWHCRIPAGMAEGARYYGYQVSGPPPQGRFEWHAFDPEKILLDPYAPAVFFPPAFDRSAAVRPGSNAGCAPLGILPGEEDVFDWGEDRGPRHESELVIYELHVRGFTRSPGSGVTPGLEGTYLGVVEKIPYLKELGVTAVELMPVFQFDPQEADFWGYMPLSFFAPHHAYATADGRQHDEFRAMVRALHAAGIEVILDVVYNHTTEQDERGPTYSFRGIDNSTYYLATGDARRPYANFTGTGNTLHTANRYVRKLIVDSLRYWVEEMHVDGFRFDLASIFTRSEDGTIDLEHPGILADITSDPVLAGVRLIAEPWDVGAYHLGRSFPGISWAQWNAHFRDDVRRFLRGDPGMVPALLRRLYGSEDLFPDDRLHAYHPYQSVNYVTSHDGFTLYDLLAYAWKRNWANGEENRDGADENYSWNCGWEGDDGAPEHVLTLRRRQAKNFCALLMLANGTPMLRAGDEFLQTQAGNNNPYNQDSPTTWLDWDRLRENEEIFRFFRRMIAFRRAHPSLCRSRFWRQDVRWHGAVEEVDMGPESRSLAFYLDGASQRDDDLYVMLNASAADLDFTLREGEPEEWRRILDTSLAAPDDIQETESGAPLSSPTYTARARSVVVLTRAGCPA